MIYAFILTNFGNVVVVALTFNIKCFKVAIHSNALNEDMEPLAKLPLFPTH